MTFEKVRQAQEAQLFKIATTKSLERWTRVGFSVPSVMEVSQAGDRPCYVGLSQSHFLLQAINTAASKRIDTNVLSVAIRLPQRSPYCSGMGPSPEPLRAPFRIFRSQTTCRTRATNPSTTSNLLFGNLQHPYQVYSWVPVHVFAGDGLNSWTVDPLTTRGLQSRPR